MRKILVGIIGIMSLTFLNTQAQFHVTKDPKDKELFVQTLDKIYNFEFVEAESLIAIIKHRFPKHPSYHMLMAVKLYWEMVFVSSEHPKYNEYMHQLEMVVAMSEPLLLNKFTRPEACFFLMGAHSSLAFIYSKNKDYTGALSQARKSYKYMKEGFTLKDKYPDFHFSTGIYNFYVEQYPETHPVLKPFMWFFPDGDKQYGIKELELGSESGTFSKAEALYFVAHVYLKYENKPEKALDFAKRLYERYPGNIFYNVRYIEALIFCNKYEDADKQIIELNKSDYPYFKMVNQFFKGMVAEHHHDKVSAKNMYEKCIHLALSNNIKTSDYLGLAYWRMATLYEQEKNKSKADEYFRRTEDLEEYSFVIEDVKRYNKKKW